MTLEEALATAGGMAMITCFAHIRDPKMRIRMIDLTASIAELEEARLAPQKSIAPVYILLLDDAELAVLQLLGAFHCDDPEDAPYDHEALNRIRAKVAQAVPRC
jgi:hypothetical protein